MMDYDGRFLMQKTVDWSLLNDGMTIPTAACALLKAWDESHFPHVESFLMNRETFDQFYESGFGTETNVEKNLCLTPEEKEMFVFLKEGNYRLEQEKIPFEYAIDNIPD